MHDISNITTLVALESPSYYASLQIKTKTKQNKQTKLHAFFPTNIESFSPTPRVLSFDFCVKRRKETKNRKIKPSHYNQLKKNKPSLSSTSFISIGILR
jgi:hypothetical protein